MKKLKSDSEKCYFCLENISDDESIGCCQSAWMPYDSDWIATKQNKTKK